MKSWKVIAIAAFLAIDVGYLFGYFAGQEAMQRQACKQGLADYDADEKGDSQFIWAVPFGEMK